MSPGAATPVSVSIVGATLLTNERGERFTGNAAAFDATGSPASLRLDPEGVRLGPTGTLFISDEYGPSVYELDADGKRLRTLGVPGRFLIASPGATASGELPPNNASGRQANRGMEGLAITPDGSRLYGIMQSPLIQDGGLDAMNRRVGTNIRIVEIDVTTGLPGREFVYQLADGRYGVSEIVAVDDHEFLVLERDGGAGTAAQFKQVFKIDIAGATDVSGLGFLPETGLPVGVTPVAKSLFLDLLDPAFALAGAGFPEKIEGLAFGPDLADGRHLLLVSSDNDFLGGQASRIFAFGIERDALPGYERQAVVPEPGTLALIGSGLIALGILYRRRVAARRAPSALGERLGERGVRPVRPGGGGSR